MFVRSLFGLAPTPKRLLGRAEAVDVALARLPLLTLGLALWAVAIVAKLTWLQVVKHRYYKSLAGRQHVQSLTIPAVRGELRDRYGVSLAVSRRVESLFVHPGVFYNAESVAKGDPKHWGEPNRKAAEEVAAKLAPILDMSKARLMEKLLARKPFVYLQRQMLPSKAEQVRALKLPQVDFLPESKRVYPMGSLACQVLGFTDIDGKGQLGIEATYDPLLAGRPGRLEAPRDAKGRLLLFQENYSQVPVNGVTLQLSLDSSIQSIVERTLQEAVNSLNPVGAYAVVVDPETGEILAMAGTPTFDPNQPLPSRFLNRNDAELSAAEREEKAREIERQKLARRVRPLEDTYEPGSTMKIFTAAMALEERKVHLGEKIDCRGPWTVNGKPITDSHPLGTLSFEEVLWQSSNIGTAKIGLRLNPKIHYQYLKKFGFGENSGLHFPGESAGLFYAPDRWSATTQQTLCFGYGLSVTPLQILMAGCAIANGGKLMQPILIQREYNDQGVLMREYKPTVRNQVLSEETSAMMREVLKGVITHGTAKKAALDGGIEAFGKTGTARKRKKVGLGYDEKRHYASFMGFFPAEKPRYGVLFMIDEPGGGRTGGDVAAPLFKKLGDAVMRYATEGRVEDRHPSQDLRLTLQDWPTSEDDEARIHVEVGRVPDVRGLPIKSAIYRIILAGGTPIVAEGGTPPGGPMKVVSQSPEPGTAIEQGKVIQIFWRHP